MFAIQTSKNNSNSSEWGNIWEKAFEAFNVDIAPNELKEIYIRKQSELDAMWTLLPSGGWKVIKYKNIWFNGEINEIKDTWHIDQWTSTQWRGLYVRLWDSNVTVKTKVYSNIFLNKKLVWWLHLGKYLYFHFPVYYTVYESWGNIKNTIELKKVDTNWNISVLNTQIFQSWIKDVDWRLVKFDCDFVIDWGNFTINDGDILFFSIVSELNVRNLQKLLHWNWWYSMISL